MKTATNININDDALRTLCQGWEEGLLTRSEELQLAAVLADYRGEDAEIIATREAMAFIVREGAAEQVRRKRLVERRGMWRRVAAVAIPAVVIVSVFIGVGHHNRSRSSFHAVSGGEVSSNPKVAMAIMNDQLDMLASGAEESAPTECEEFIFEN